MTITALAPPAEEPLSLAAAKDYLRIGHDGEDALVADLLASARARLEQAAGLALVTRVLRLTLAAWPDHLLVRGLGLRPGPVQRLLGVRIVDATGAPDDVTDFFSHGGGRVCVRPSRLTPPIPVEGRAEIEFETGFGAASDVPGDLRLALKLLLAEGYRRRDAGASGGALPPDVAEILAQRREVRL